jgi:predicted ATPase
MHITQVCLHPDSFPANDCYPFSLEIFHETGCIGFTKPVTFFIGENGTGKSTLLKAIARRCDIHIWEEYSGSRYRYNRYENDLYRYVTVEWQGKKVPGSFFASEIFRHFAELLDAWAGDDPGTLQYFGNASLVEKSHGQSHMAFFENRFSIPGLYLLDEPENALSPRMQLELLRLFRLFATEGDAQFIIATHSPILLAYPDAEIYRFDEAPIRKVAYEDTDYFRIYRDFLNDREHFLEEIEPRG